MKEVFQVAMEVAGIGLCVILFAVVVMVLLMYLGLVDVDYPDDDEGYL